MFLSGVCFALGGLCIKYIPWNPLAINSARNILSAIVLGLFMLAIKHKLVINKHVILSAIAIATTTGLYCFANKLTTAGNAIILQFTAPIWVMFFSVLFLKVHPKSLDIIAAVCVFVGVILFFIDGISAGNMLGNILALLSGITYVGVFTSGSFEDSDTLSATFLGILINVLVGLPFLLKEDLGAASQTTWIALLVLGIVQQGCSYIFLSLGLKTTPAIPASLISGIEPVLNPILVAVFYGEHLTPLALVGAAIVLVSIVGYNVIKCK